MTRATGTQAACLREVAALVVRVHQRVAGALVRGRRSRDVTRIGVARTQQRNRFYRARREALGPVAEMLERMWDDSLWKLKLAAELEESRRGPKSQRRRARKRNL